MRFLIILLVLIVLYKLVSRIYQFISRINEPFDGNCILPGTIPTFKDSELNYENIKAKYILSANTAISMYSLINKLILGYTLIDIYTEISIDRIDSISFINPLA